MAGYELEISEEDAGTRLDVLLARRVTGVTRATAKRLVAEGIARVDGRAVKKSYLVSVGDRVTVDEVPDSGDFDAAPDPAASLDVRYESDDFVVVEKPVGMPSHPLVRGELGTVAGLLVARYPEMKGVGYAKREPGILHRLDRDTSGLMLAARNHAAFERLRRLLNAGEIEKRYLARCVGTMAAPAVLDGPIANDPRDRRRVRVCTDPREIKRLGALPARTDVLASTPAELGSLVEVQANHARRHQIRAHLAAAGHPLLGDALYGGPALEQVGHHLLHASVLRVDDVLVEAGPWKYRDVIER